MKRSIIYFIVVLVFWACSNGEQSDISKLLPGDFNSFYVKIDGMKKIDDTKQVVFVENDAPARFKFLEIEEGGKFCISYAGSLGKRDIKYFKKNSFVYIEDINIEYNKIFNYDEDTVKLEIVKQDTIKYFIEANVLRSTCINNDSLVVGEQISIQAIDRSKELLEKLKKVSEASRL